MKKRVFIIHRWGGVPDTDWYLWLRKELENLGYEAQAPLMLDTMHPKTKEKKHTNKFIAIYSDEDNIFRNQ